MADISEKYRAALSDAADPESFQRVLGAAHTGADRVVRRRRLTYGGIGAASLALAVTLGMSVPSALQATEQPISPAGAPAAATSAPPPTPSPQTTTATSVPAPTPTFSVGIKPRRPVMSTKGPQPSEVPSPASPAPGSPEAAGYVAHPEMALRGEAVPYFWWDGGAEGALDEREAENTPRGIPDPKTGPYARLLLDDAALGERVLATRTPRRSRSHGAEVSAGPPCSPSPGREG